MVASQKKCRCKQNVHAHACTKTPINGWSKPGYTCFVKPSCLLICSSKSVKAENVCNRHVPDKRLGEMLGLVKVLPFLDVVSDLPSINSTILDADSGGTWRHMVLPHELMVERSRIGLFARPDGIALTRTTTSVSRK